MKVNGYTGTITSGTFQSYYPISLTGQTNTTCGSPSCTATAGDFIFQMASTALTVPLQQKLFQGLNATVIPTVDVVFATSTTSASVFYEIHLTNVRVKTIAQASNGDNIQDQISFTYETISWKFKPATGTAVTGCWNISGNASCTAPAFPF